jgi:hypothetical protein
MLRYYIGSDTCLQIDPLHTPLYDSRRQHQASRERKFFVEVLFCERGCQVTKSSIVSDSSKLRQRPSGSTYR